MKRVLVLGGTGFVSKSIALEFYKSGYAVSVLNRGNNNVLPQDIKLIKANRDDAKEMSEALADKEYEIVVDASFKNDIWVKNLVDAININTIESFVFISSSSVYDVENLKAPYKEDDKLNKNIFWCDYGENKIKAESMYQNVFREKSTKLIILRPPYIFGEENNVQRESFVFKHIEENLPIIIPSTNRKLQFIYIADLCAIVKFCVENINDNISIYNVGNKKLVTGEAWVKACEQVVGKKAIVKFYDAKKFGSNVRDFYPFHDYDNVLSVEKLDRIYSKETPLKVGLRNAYFWYKQYGEQIQFKQSVEANIKLINEQLEKL